MSPTGTPSCPTSLSKSTQTHTIYKVFGNLPCLMKEEINLKELSNIKENILKEIKPKNKIELKKIKLIAGFDLVFFKEEILCAGILIDFKTKEMIETQITKNEIPFNYYSELIAFREGPSILNTLNQFSKKPDILMIEGNGLINKKILGLPTYVGVLSNIPTIGVSKKLIFGKLEVDKILFENKQVGYAIKTKDYANPIYVIPGNDISFENAKIITEMLCLGNKMPMPIHKAHSILIKEKKLFNSS